MASTKNFSIDSDPIVLIDGECVLCNGVARFVIRHDPSGRIRFAALGSPAASAVLSDRQLPPPPPGTFVLIENGAAHYRSEGALRLASKLDRPWRYLAWLSIVPRPIRDAVYAFVAAVRYRLAGRVATCSLLDPAERKRFL
ncbi:MAG: DCC1-like thiol-disulfide oxidoreductase family protein [Terrimicrobiaceae bacterium]|nr:DCC1-like thiol-disulfide oxidoreductase family protein [Terrimicrobiaceae bacterium]